MGRALRKKNGAAGRRGAFQRTDGLMQMKKRRIFRRKVRYPPAQRRCALRLASLLRGLTSAFWKPLIRQEVPLHPLLLADSLTAIREVREICSSIRQKIHSPADSSAVSILPCFFPECNDQSALPSSGFWDGRTQALSCGRRCAERPCIFLPDAHSSRGAETQITNRNQKSLCCLGLRF